MRTQLLVFGLFAVPAFAGNVLSPGSTYPVKNELKEAGPAVKFPASYYAEMQVDFESYDALDPATMLMGTHTDQLLKTRRLPKGSDGVRTELTYQRMTSTSKVHVPGLPQLFETRVDLGTVLASRPIILVGDEAGPKKAENLADVRASALQQVKDAPSRTTLNMVLTDDLMLKAGSAVQDFGCLAELAGKKPGEKWKFSRAEQGITLAYDCTFEGWSETMQKRVAVVRVHSGKLRTPRQLPDGKAGMAEMDSDGIIFLEPLAPESLTTMENHILVEPTEEEIARLKAVGRTVPRNRSLMRNWNHLYPL